MEYLDNTIKFPEDVKQYLDVPFLGPVPAIMDGKNRNSKKEETSVEKITLDAPKSTASEAYRGIRTSILFSSAKAEPQVILVSSAGPQEGKTITSANLSITMAQSGSKVVLIDCDLRRPRVHKVFGAARDKGMTNLLVGNIDIKEAVSRTDISNLYILPSGPIPPNPSELLGSSKLVEVMNALKRNFDRVIIDSSPITAVTDSVVLSKVTDGVVLVIKANDTAREIVKNGLNQLQSVGAHIIGAVLNGVDMGKDSYYYYQYYYYYYGEDGEKGKKSSQKKRSKNRYD